MGLIRFIGRAIGGLVGLGIAALVFIPVIAVVATVGVPVLIMLAVAGAIGAVGLFTVGIPMLIVAVLAIAALGAVIALAGGAIALGILVLKVVLFAMLLSWLFRKLFSRPRAPERALVGLRVADIGAPRRDKYDIAAERELDEELGI